MKIQATRADAYKLIHEGALALGRAERQGMRIDVRYCEKKQAQLVRKIERYQKVLMDSKFYWTWKKIYGEKVNINSNHQLALAA